MINRKNLEIITNSKIILKNSKCRRGKSNQWLSKSNQLILLVLSIRINYIRIRMRKLILLIPMNLKAAMLKIRTYMKQKNNNTYKKHQNIIL